jgi:hypothetical protein
MFGVPVQVVATLCGPDEDDAVRAGQLIGDFVRCIPASAPAPDQAAATDAAARLLDLLRPRVRAEDTGLLGELVRTAVSTHLPPDDGPPLGGQSDTRSQPDARLLANGVGLLSQTCPGRALAVAVTAGVVGTLIEHDLRGVRQTYRPSPNARIPVLRTG